MAPGCSSCVKPSKLERNYFAIEQSHHPADRPYESLSLTRTEPLHSLRPKRPPSNSPGKFVRDYFFCRTTLLFYICRQILAFWCFNSFDSGNLNSYFFGKC